MDGAGGRMATSRSRRLRAYLPLRHRPFGLGVIRVLQHPRLRCLLKAAAIAAWLPSAVAGQECASGPIEEVVFEREKPFDAETAGPDATFGWLFRTMNAFHIRTRESTLRWELLVAESECLDPTHLEESERALRQLSYIVDADIASETLPGGGHRVVVRTQDSWAASAGASVSLDGGITVTGLSASAKNVFGTGTRASLFRTSFRERKRTGFLLRQPNLLGTRLDVTAAVGRTQPDRFWMASALRPFSGEIGRWAFRQSWVRRDDFFAYAAPSVTESTHAYRRVVADRFDVQLQHRLGATDGSRLLVGVGWGRESLRDPAGDGALVVIDSDFDAPLPAPPGVRATLGLQSGTFDLDRLYGVLGLRRLRFVERSGMDAFSASQDAPYGVEITGAFGRSIRERAGSLPDRWVGLRGSAATGSDDAYVNVRASAEGRRIDGERGWRDVVYESELSSWWFQSPTASLFLRFEAAGGHRNSLPLQLTLGGWTGVRGYAEDAFPAGRRLVMNVEQRTSLFGWAPGLADVGVALYLDAGRTTAAVDVPFGEDSGWRTSAGFGLRMALPRGSPDVLRVDVGTPLTGDRSRHGVVFRVYTELFGLLDRRTWPSQVQRSRWNGLDTDLTSRPRNPLAGS